MGRNPFLESPTKQIQAKGKYIYIYFLHKIYTSIYIYILQLHQLHMFIYHGHPKPTLLEVFMVNNIVF